MDKRLAFGLGLAALAAAAPVLGGSSQDGMQVDEPAVTQSAPPINPEKESLSWQDKSKSKALTEEQKAAMRERQERMQELIKEIKEKRKELEGASPEQRAELARELHRLILDREDEGNGASEQARENQQERRAKLMEFQEKLRQKLEDKRRGPPDGKGPDEQ